MRAHARVARGARAEGGGLATSYAEMPTRKEVRSTLDAAMRSKLRRPSSALTRRLTPVGFTVVVLLLLVLVLLPTLSSQQLRRGRERAIVLSNRVSSPIPSLPETRPRTHAHSCHALDMSALADRWAAYIAERMRPHMPPAAALLLRWPKSVCVLPAPTCRRR